jgi:hypothetical protein
VAILASRERTTPVDDLDTFRCGPSLTANRKRQCA